MKKLIIGNWKANKSLAQAQTWLETVSISSNRLDLSNITPILAPAFSLLDSMRPVTTELNWQLAAQDLSPFPAGSYTGAISAINLKSLSVSYVLVGHSERRQYFKETSQEVATKAELALEAGITPIVCVSNLTLAEQASAFDVSLAKRCIIAYEPLEAIGTGNEASLGSVKEFKNKVKLLFGEVPFLYGGSVDELNVGEYLLVTDGALVGTASLKAEQFINLLKTAQGDKPAVT
ncbi:MAG: triose-phosphate isomerase [Candidatus Paceibacterota bacterium]